jgi:murein DD-endopeptidase MepM/ murein hydrolase activator NlpD
VDVGLDAGERVKAALSGVVTRVTGTTYSGWQVEIDHGFGLVTVYSHLGSALVEAGDVVGTGDPVGLAGQPGSIEGDLGMHLHFEMRVNGQVTDPTPYLGG